MKKGSGQCLKICSKIKNRVKLTCNTIVSNINDEKNISYFETLQVCLKVLFVCPPLAPLKPGLLQLMEENRAMQDGKQEEKKLFCFCCHCGLMTLKLCPCNHLVLETVCVTKSLHAAHTVFIAYCNMNRTQKTSR